ncbi:MAG: hypothetical protein CNE98_00845 [Bacteroidetes bacterium MED-G17]|nr:MAG: hypothetical protein CBB99_05700 [Bacteroidetes bacterium TMED39]PDH53637.1 MAG: hypothetical protein CNE98_00845 [Bacteroidetes bacterium MED-G17]CAI8271681.1 MAG: Uncharacterised protein [Bacteroidetes bacterium MED-G17]|tara:strand:- start:42518 stop:43072 length:555 start_codon:yes stop_codon:yes gene_type:complete
MIGTVFFAVLNKSINEGSKQGIYFTLGLGLSDFFMISAAVFGSRFIPFVEYYSGYLKAFGGIFLIAYGLYNLLFNKKPQKKNTALSWRQSSSNITLGFLLNSLNPANFMGWVSLAIYLKSRYNLSTLLIAVVLGSIAILIILSDSLASVYAQKLQRCLNTKRIRQINIVTGLVFIFSGVGVLAN